MPEYVVRIGDEELCRTDWHPIAVAAWDRATRNWDAARKIGDWTASLEIDGELIASEKQRPGGHPWPECDMLASEESDVAAAIIQLCRVAGVAPADLAQAMTDSGLPTTRSRLKSISTTEENRRSRPCAAELVVMCYAAIGKIRKVNPGALSAGKATEKS